jgi:hypothetical protein
MTELEFPTGLLPGGGEGSTLDVAPGDGGAPTALLGVHVESTAGGTVAVTDPAGAEIYAASFSGEGSADVAFTPPLDMTTGTYSFDITGDITGHFRVDDGEL